MIFIKERPGSQTAKFELEFELVHSKLGVGTPRYYHAQPGTTNLSFNKNYFSGFFQGVVHRRTNLQSNTE